MNKKARSFVFYTLVVATLFLGGCGDFSDPCDDLIKRVCDNCSANSCRKWKDASKADYFNELYCIKKLDNFQDEILPFCNEDK